MSSMMSNTIAFDSRSPLVGSSRTHKSEDPSENAADFSIETPLGKSQSFGQRHRKNESPSENATEIHDDL